MLRSVFFQIVYWAQVSPEEMYLLLSPRCNNGCDCHGLSSECLDERVGLLVLQTSSPHSSQGRELGLSLGLPRGGGLEIPSSQASGTRSRNPSSLSLVLSSRCPLPPELGWNLGLSWSKLLAGYPDPGCLSVSTVWHVEARPSIWRDLCLLGTGHSSSCGMPGPGHVLGLHESQPPGPELLLSRLLPNVSLQLVAIIPPSSTTPCAGPLALLLPSSYHPTVQPSL